MDGRGQSRVGPIRPPTIHRLPTVFSQRLQMVGESERKSLLINYGLQRSSPMDEIYSPRLNAALIVHITE